MPAQSAVRRLAPEAVPADAGAGAAALEQSAVQLRAAGMADRAAELEAEASRERKRAEAAELPTGKRLDDLQRWLGRAEGRLVKGDAAVVDAEVALQAAREARDKLQLDLDDGKRRLQELREELASSGDAAMPTVAAAEPSAVHAQVAELQAELERARAESGTLRAESDHWRATGSTLETRAAAEAQKLKDLLRASNNENDRLRARQVPVGKNLPADPGALHAAIVDAQAALAAAWSAEDWNEYEAALEKHSRLASALACAMRKKCRET